MGDPRTVSDAAVESGGAPRAAPALPETPEQTHPGVSGGLVLATRGIEEKSDEFLIDRTADFLRLYQDALNGKDVLASFPHAKDYKYVIVRGARDRAVKRYFEKFADALKGRGYEVEFVPIDGYNGTLDQNARAVAEVVNASKKRVVVDDHSIGPGFVQLATPYLDDPDKVAGEIMMTPVIAEGADLVGYYFSDEATAAYQMLKKEYERFGGDIETYKEQIPAVLTQRLAAVAPHPHPVFALESEIHSSPIPIFQEEVERSKQAKQKTDGIMWKGHGIPSDRKPEKASLGDESHDGPTHVEVTNGDLARGAKWDSRALNEAALAMLLLQMAWW